MGRPTCMNIKAYAVDAMNTFYAGSAYISRQRGTSVFVSANSSKSSALPLSHHAKEIKIANKITNVLEITHNPPADWPLERKREYLLWAGQVVNGCRGANQGLEDRFDKVLENARLSIGVDRIEQITGALEGWHPRSQRRVLRDQIGQLLNRCLIMRGKLDECCDNGRE